MEKKLYRDERHKVIGGVCAGLADYFGIDVSIIRVLFLLTLILKGGGGLLYIILMIVLPKRDYTLNDPTVDYTIPPQQPYNPFSSTPRGQEPFVNMPPKRTSTGAMIVGTILIIIGAAFLLNEYDIIPELDFERIWPISLIIVGLVFIFSSRRKDPWEKDNWQKVKKDDEPAEKDSSLNDNPPTV